MGEPQNYDPKELLYRIGTFFLLIGIGSLVIFLLSESAKDPQFNYFCASMLLLTIAFIFRAQYKKTITPSGRFSGFFNLFKRGGGDEEEDDE